MWLLSPIHCLSWTNTGNIKGFPSQGCKNSLVTRHTPWHWPRSRHWRWHALHVGPSGHDSLGRPGGDLCSDLDGELDRATGRVVFGEGLKERPVHKALVHCVGQLWLPVHYRTARFCQSAQNQVATKCDVRNTVSSSHFLQALQLKCHFHNWVG